MPVYKNMSRHLKCLTLLTFISNIRRTIHIQALVGIEMCKHSNCQLIQAPDVEEVRFV